MVAHLTGVAALAFATLLAVATAHLIPTANNADVLVSAKAGDGFDYFMFVRSVPALRAQRPAIPLRCPNTAFLVHRLQAMGGHLLQRACLPQGSRTRVRKDIPMFPD